MTTAIRAFHLCITTPAMFFAGLVMAILTLPAIPFGWLEGVLRRRRAAKVAPEVPPAEERPYIPQPARDAVAESQRMQRALREEQLRIAYNRRRWEAQVQRQINDLVEEIEHG